MFTAVEIESFRGFGKLSLEDLGRVNLVVGKNNTGKTSLLEAIALVADPNLIERLPGLFRNPEPVHERFHRWLLKDGAGTDGVSISARRRDTPVGDEVRRVVLRTSEQQPPKDFGVSWREGGFCLSANLPLFPLKAHAVSVQHRGPESMVDAFAEAVRAPVDQRQMESLLAAVDPRVKDVRLDVVQSKPFIVVDIGLTNRVPLSQIGQGIYRLVAIFSELLASKPDVCFIDEIENGIHYTALPAVWKGIAEVAERLDLQVFATTHSRECLVAAHETFAARNTYDLRVVQLYRLGDETSGRVLDKAHIEAAIAGEIEVR
jgi:hypothetical protein